MSSESPLCCRSTRNLRSTNPQQELNLGLGMCGPITPSQSPGDRERILLKGQHTISCVRRMANLGKEATLRLDDLGKNGFLSAVLGGNRAPRHKLIAV